MLKPRINLKMAPILPHVVQRIDRMSNRYGQSPFKRRRLLSIEEQPLMRLMPMAGYGREQPDAVDPEPPATLLSQHR